MVKHEKSISSITTIAKFFIQLSVTIGVLATIKYCSEIGYYPSGLTIGDTIFFVAVSLTFTTSYFVITGAFLCAGITVSPFLRCLQALVIVLYNFTHWGYSKKKPWWKLNFPPLSIDMLPVVFSGLVVITFVIESYISNRESAIEFSLVTFVMGVLWGFWNKKLIRKKYDSKIKRDAIGLKLVLIFFCFAAPSYFIESGDGVFDYSMELIGVKVGSSVIQIPAKYSSFSEIKPDRVTEKGDAIYKDAVILFHGIGSNVVVEIKGMRMVIPTKDIIIGHKVKEDSLKK